MDKDLFIKIATVVIAFIGGCILLWRANKELFFGSRNSLREEYKFAKAFFDDLEKQPKMHPYVRQKGFQGIAGNQSLSPTVIEYLLTLHDPATVLNDYVFSCKLLEHSPVAGTKQIRFKNAYSDESRRKNLKWIYVAIYGASYTIAVSPILAGQWGLLSKSLSFGLLLITLPFLAATVASIQASRRMHCAERLVNNQ